HQTSFRMNMENRFPIVVKPDQVNKRLHHWFELGERLSIFIGDAERAGSDSSRIEGLAVKDQFVAQTFNHHIRARSKLTWGFGGSCSLDGCGNVFLEADRLCAHFCPDLIVAGFPRREREGKF